MLLLFVPPRPDLSPLGQGAGENTGLACKVEVERSNEDVVRSPTSERGDEDLHTRFALLVSTLTLSTRRVITGSLYVDREHPLVVSTVVDGAPDLPLLETGKLLHTQMGVSPRRVADACSRCARRVQNDLLCSSTLNYSWRDMPLAAEFYLVGRPDNWAIFTIHHPHQAQSGVDGEVPPLRPAGTRPARPRGARYTLTCLPRCARAPARRNVISAKCSECSSDEIQTSAGHPRSCS